MLTPSSLATFWQGRQLQQNPVGTNHAVTWHSDVMLRENPSIYLLAQLLCYTCKNPMMTAEKYLFLLSVALFTAASRVTANPGDTSMLWVQLKILYVTVYTVRSMFISPVVRKADFIDIHVLAPTSATPGETFTAYVHVATTQPQSVLVRLVNSSDGVIAHDGPRTILSGSWVTSRYVITPRHSHKRVWVRFCQYLFNGGIQSSYGLNPSHRIVNQCGHNRFQLMLTLLLGGTRWRWPWRLTLTRRSKEHSPSLSEAKTGLSWYKQISPSTSRDKLVISIVWIFNL